MKPARTYPSNDAEGIVPSNVHKPHSHKHSHKHPHCRPKGTGNNKNRIADDNGRDLGFLSISRSTSGLSSWKDHSHLPETYSVRTVMFHEQKRKRKTTNQQPRTQPPDLLSRKIPQMSRVNCQGTNKDSVGIHAQRNDHACKGCISNAQLGTQRIDLNLRVMSAPKLIESVPVIFRRTKHFNGHFQGCDESFGAEGLPVPGTVALFRGSNMSIIEDRPVAGFSTK